MIKKENFFKDILGIDYFYYDHIIGNDFTDKSIPSPSLNLQNSSKFEQMQKIIEEVSSCFKCILGKTRLNVVPGEGNLDAEIMFIGEGPGEDEDRQGRPFVGRAGQLLTKMIEAMGYKREEVYIANIVKCRPPNNRAPFDEEAFACIGYVKKQIEIVNPKVIVTLGSTATRYLLNTDKKISTIRGEFQEYNGIKVMPTFHPSYLLRNQSMKKPAWEDLKKVIAFLKK
ncbi:uracil-DNA glycosylase [Calditerrivibrio nitroreducens]|uniref:Type-4 uracil-DNA glycosylase n=1 Tax=Calditerrivibrio nitroreducens (strain DSM 19672 / NBRC 101217 / Yu37-1) TaxID=768670 RepID=E4THZ4_CALNY|nr:uracil-DNA glycosylase [Calditerrivibrio nitroreducens]ADR18924.1 phage SPO1 DNA polymerase-related protein [Calditerrivibrio nitroreducens DSM 19672]